MKNLLLAFAIMATMLLPNCACEDRAGATKTLQAMGFKDIKLQEPKAFFSGCGKEDQANNPFTATNAQGELVEGIVCCGGPLSTKGCTVRF